jgi:two-component system chemotaxis sensor kinase CheA
VKQGLPFGDGGAFREIFFEEAREHLEATETNLLKLDPCAPCPDELNAIFRAVHSIKGSAAMLGFQEIGVLAHVFENLLDLLRKGERAVTREDVDAMLQAGDVVKAQVGWRRGELDAAPDAEAAEALLRERVKVPSAGGGSTGATSRSFHVRVGPLPAPVDAAELEMMLAGLAEMGAMANEAVHNVAGGSVAFDVTLDGTEIDLRSILALVAPPDLTHVGPVPLSAGDPAPIAAEAGHEEASELFVNPDEFRRTRASAAANLSAVPAGGDGGQDEGVDLFVSPENFNARKAAPTANAATARLAAPAGPITPAAPGASSIRVATEKIDQLVNLVGELVITESVLSREAALAGLAAGRAGAGLAELARNTRELQEAVLAIRMVPISDAFARFPRLVRELSDRLGKQVALLTQGESTELDRGLIEKILDPLMHLVRNAVDHGLETPQVRVAAGKQPTGTVTLAASQRGGKVVIEVSDDGRGLDRALILARAVERGRVLPPQAPDDEVWQLLFDAGFSTAQEVTEVSGRGVGMDVVRRNILSLGGTVEVASRAGRGLTVTMTVPLTLAIMEAMTVSLAGQIYVLPLASVVESRGLAPGDLHVLPGQGETLCVRGTYLPVLRLAALFPPQAPAPHGDGIAVVVEAQGSCAALLVDALEGQQQVVIKSLETNFRKVPGATGATIMSDGSVALILDVSHVVQMCRAARPLLAA